MNRLQEPLTRLLWPSQVTIIPFSVILLIFLVFIIMVGPGDWYLLGLLKARRFTWVLFPVVAIACTWFTVALSRHYLGGEDQRQRLEIVDLGPGDRVLRHDRVELVFTGANRTVVSEPKDATWAMLEARDPNANAYRQMADPGRTASVGIPAFHGAIGGGLTVAQEIGQWTPALRRELSFADCALPWTLDLDQVTSRAAAKIWADAVAGRIGGDVVIARFTGERKIPLRGTFTSLGGNSYDERQADWLSAICSHPILGWSTLCSQSSPAGGATTDDLAILDPSDPAQFLIVVAQRRGDTVWVTRRLFREPLSGTGIPAETQGGD